MMAIGLVELSFDKNRTLILEDCLLVSYFKRNLFFVSCLIKHGLIVQFNSSVSIRNKYSFICYGTLFNALYFLSPMYYDINAIETINDNEHDHLSKKMTVSNKTNETYLWHSRLGQINPNKIQGLVKSGILSFHYVNPTWKVKRQRGPSRPKKITQPFNKNWYTLMYMDQ